MKGKRIRYQQTGEFHFLTFSCYRRRSYLTPAAAMDLFEDALERVRRRYLCAVAGYVVMPEHVHLLVNEPKHALLSRAVQALKLSVSMRSRERPFWQAHYYDFNVHTHDKHVEKLRYIHRNPVTRGLVARPEDWKWSSFPHYQTGMRGTVEIESEWTARQRGWQLPEWMRDHRPVSSTSPVPPPRRTRDRGHPRLDRTALRSGPPATIDQQSGRAVIQRLHHYTMSNRGSSVKYFVGLFTWILIASGWPMATQQLEAAQVNKPQPADIRINHDVLVEDQRLEYIFLDVLRGTGLRGGFVEIAGCSGLPKGRLQIKQGVAVRQAMNALVAANPGYRWELKDGVVNLMPRGGAPLLRARIAKFQVNATDREILVVIGDVLALPEVRQRKAELGLKPGMGGIGLFAGERHPVPRQPVPVHVSVQNLSLREAFNKIVQAFPKGVWIYHETNCNGTKTYTVEVTSDY